MKTTAYFDAVRLRPDRRMIREEWIERAIHAPLRESRQQDGRLRRWIQVPEMNNRYLRVILLPDAATVHNAFFDRRIHPMKVRYFADTDTLFIEFKEAPVAETRDLDENTLLDIDAQGNICAITVEHASKRTGAPRFSYEQVPAA